MKKKYRSSGKIPGPALAGKFTSGRLHISAYGLLLFCIIILLTFLSGCSSTKDKVESEEMNLSKSGKLESFEYAHSSYLYRPFIYGLKRETDSSGKEQLIFYADGYQNREINLEVEVDEDFAASIAAIIEEENIFAWDGFQEAEMEIRDGFGFSLQAKFENTSIKASGYMKYPDNFKESHERLSQYLLDRALDFLDK